MFWGDIVDEIRYLASGDMGIVMEFANKIDKDVNARILSVVNSLKEEKIEGILDILPTYRSIQVNYDPSVISYSDIKKKLESLEKTNVGASDSKVRLIEIPTIYGGEYGPDIDFVAENANLSVDEVIKIHSSTSYLVYMMGFMPGFTYLGGLDERIATPRLKSPRLRIPAGSVGIAANQTGMYPVDSPGGWQLIGRTPLKLYDEKNDPPVFVNAGDYIKYVPIDEAEFEKIKEEVERGEYKVKISVVNADEVEN